MMHAVKDNITSFCLCQKHAQSATNSQGKENEGATDSGSKRCVVVVIIIIKTH